MIQAVIFDMDGTMVDTETIHSESFSQFLLNRGISPQPNPNGLVHLIGVNTEDILKFLMKKYKFSGDILQIKTEIRNIYFDLLTKTEIQPMKGLQTLLQLLQKAHIHLAVASGSSSKNIHAMLKNVQLDTFFSVVVGADQVTNGKPDPEIYETTVKKLGVRKNACVVIEDAESGIKAAKAAGLKVIAVPNRFTKTHDFTKADTIVDSLSDITLSLLEKL